MVHLPAAHLGTPLSPNFGCPSRADLKPTALLSRSFRKLLYLQPLMIAQECLKSFFFFDSS